MYASTLPRSNWLRRASIRLAWYRHMPASSYYYYYYYYYYMYMMYYTFQFLTATSKYTQIRPRKPDWNWQNTSRFSLYLFQNRHRKQCISSHHLDTNYLTADGNDALKYKKLSYRKRIARSCTHNTSRASIVTRRPWNLAQGLYKIISNGTIR